MMQNKISFFIPADSRPDHRHCWTDALIAFARTTLLGLVEHIVHIAGLRVTAVLPFTNFSSVSRIKRIFTFAIMRTVHFSEVSMPGQRNVM